MTAGQWWHHLSVWAARQGQPPSHALVLGTGLLPAAAVASLRVWPVARPARGGARVCADVVPVVRRAAAGARTTAEQAAAPTHLERRRSAGPAHRAAGRALGGGVRLGRGGRPGPGRLASRVMGITVF